jgi:hypothetical protein
MALDKLVNQVFEMLKKYKIVAVVCVFLSFFVAVTILNFVQKATLEGFITLQQQKMELENFANHVKKHNKNKENFANHAKKHNKKN